MSNEGLSTKYRAIVKISLEEESRTITFTGDWVTEKAVAEDALEKFKPFKSEWGEIFDGYVEKKTEVE